MVRITNQNSLNENDKPNGISFRRKEQLAGEVIWSVFEKASQTNSRFNALDILFVNVHSVRMPVVFGKCAIKSKGIPLSVMAQLKISVIELKADDNSLAHPVIITLAKVKIYPNCVAYRKGRTIPRVVRNLFVTTGIDFSGCGGSPN